MPVKQVLNHKILKVRHFIPTYVAHISCILNKGIYNLLTFRFLGKNRPSNNEEVNTG